MSDVSPTPEPRRFRWLIAGGLALAVVVAASAFVVSVLPAGGPPGAAPEPGVSESPSARDGSSSATPEPVATPAPMPTQGGADGTEQNETPGGPRASVGNPPASAPLPPLLSAPLPASASAVGALVAGFPGSIPLAKHSTIASSSIASSGNTVQATLVAATTTSAADVTAYYEAVFATLGLPGSPVDAVGGSTGVAFARGGESVTLTVSPAVGGSRYSLFGVLTVTP